jgi:peptidylprolyl isomerase
VPDQPRGKRRRGQQQQLKQRRVAKPLEPRPQGVRPVRRVPVRGSKVGGSTVSGMPSLPLLAIGALAVVILVLGFILLRPFGGASAEGCPKTQPPALGGGQTRTVTLTTPKGTIVIKVEADLSPIAAGNFVALASCGFYDNTPFHRTATLEDGTPFVIQGGDPTGTGTGGPGYTIKDEPVKTPYKRGTVAMARSSAANSVGSQFFVVLDDKDAAVLSDANTYQIIGSVTAGMETADAIYKASNGAENPTNPVRVTTATVATP